MIEKEKLRQWIIHKTKALKKELDSLPDTPGQDSLLRYQDLTLELLKLAQMKAKHFPPVKDPDPRFLEVLY